MAALFLHQLPDIQQFYEIVGQEKNVLPVFVKKDYWLMHTLRGIQKQGLNLSFLFLAPTQNFRTTNP
jgi:hypothetical protein